MVFPGKFSTGCSLCRKRKVKCDEGKPSCRRCYIYGKPCPGYTDQFRFRHSSQSQGLGQPQQQEQQFQSQGPTQTQFQVNQGPSTQGQGKTSPAASRASPVNRSAPLFETLSFSVEPAPTPNLGQGTLPSPPTTATPASTSGGRRESIISLSPSEIQYLPVGQTRRPTHAERRKRQREKEAAQSALVHGRPLDSSVIPLDILFPQIAPSPELSYNDVSLSYFVSRFVSADGADAFPGHMTWLPGLFNQYDQKGPFELATLSVAQMAAFNKFGSPKFRDESYKNHGKALKALHNVIMGVTEATEEGVEGEPVQPKPKIDPTDDKVLATVLLLCAYKDISGEGLGDPSSHASGLYYLLEKRGLEQISSRSGFELYIMALLRLQVYAFLHEDDSYCNPGGIASFLAEIDPLMRAMHMMSRVHVLRHDLSKLSLNMMEKKQKSPSPPASGSSPPADRNSTSPKVEQAQPELYCDDGETLAACFQMLEELDEWDAEAANYWMRTFQTRTVPKQLGGLTDTQQTHYDPETACTIILIRSVRFILLFTFLEHHQRMQLLTNGAYAGVGGQGQQWAECLPVFKHTILSTIDDILGLVPYAFGDVDPSGRPTSMACDGAGALMILHPLRLVTYCPYATVDQIRRGKDILDRVNRHMGIRSAQAWFEGENYATYRWAFTQSSPREMMAGMSALSLDDDFATAV